MGTIGTASALDHLTEKKIKTKEFQVTLTQYKKSIRGNYYFSLVDFSKAPAGPALLLSLNTEGILRFQRLYKRKENDPQFALVLNHFKKLDNGLYSYFVSKYNDGPGCSAEIKFLNTQLEDLIVANDPNRDSELDCHDIATNPLQPNLVFYLFYRKYKGGINPEVQAWDPTGKVVFSWLGSNYFPPTINTYFNDPLHLNSIDFTPSGEMVLSLNGPSSVLFVDTRSGKILENISREKWKFEHDKRGGFKNQHSVHVLKNGNLLLYDNGKIEKLPPRAVEYKLNFQKKIATLVWEYEANQIGLDRSSEGSVQRLSNGNTLIAWGAPGAMGTYKKLDHNNIFSEIDKKGEVVRELWSNDALITLQVYFENE
jgi:hypothetical protein